MKKYMRPEINSYDIESEPYCDITISTGNWEHGTGDDRDDVWGA